MADYFWKSVQASCPDGRVRKVRARHHVFDGSMAADTFFSVPARVSVGKKTVTGYLSCTDEGALEFRVHDRYKEVFFPGAEQQRKQADKIDGYDRDDLGEGPDY